MNEIKERLLNLSTYGFTSAGIAVNFDNIKSGVLFFLGFVLLILQIVLHVKKIKNERLKKR